MKKIIFLALSILTISFSCKPKEIAITSPKKEITQADKILAKAFEAHGGKKYETAHYSFVFRKNKYAFKNNYENYEYSVVYQKDGITTLDKLNNNGFTRIVDDEKITLSEKDSNKFMGALNSVIYFATLPHKLQDPAVKKSYQGETKIKGETYDVLEITFMEENGGQDHDDEFYYWINKTTNRIDYLAYNYQVNNGGVRFRSAYNPRVVDGVLFQDYVNYKAEVGTSLADLPALFEKEELKKLSVIETVDVVRIKEK